MFSKYGLLLILISLPALASYESAGKNYGNGSISLSGYRRTIIDLVRDGHYYSVVPWMKDYLVRNNASLDSELEDALDKILSMTGVKPFEALPEEVLRHSRSSNVRYILAKHLMKRGRNEEALKEISGIKENNAAFPFAANMKAALYAQLGNENAAEDAYRDCASASQSRLGKVELGAQKEQLEINRDYCLAGIARVQFGQRAYSKAELNYLDIPKDSFVWPEILFEEAWTSYYKKNYNRTLGKLVSYKAPVFDFIFKPEVEVLRALTFMKMCLYDDAKRTVDGFYNELLEPSRALRNFLIGSGKNYRRYYDLMAAHEEGKQSELQILDTALRSIQKDGAYIELKGALRGALREYNVLRKKSNSSMRANLIKNIQTVLDEYRTIIGAYVRAGLVGKYGELYSAFQGMSYIKLEVLAQRKEQLYRTDVETGRKRGDVKYIERNDKQYFWNFNGEFWADELGDYVFALRSEC
jgi:hypothetical protein